MEDQYFDKDNFELLISIVDNDVKEKIGNDTNIVSLRSILYDNMEEVFSNSESDDTLDILNKKVLVKTIEDIIDGNLIETKNLEIIKEFATSEPKVESSREFMKEVNITDVDLFDKLEKQIEDDRKEDPVSLNKTEEKTLDVESYDLINKTDEEKKGDISFTDNTEINEVSIDISSADRSNILSNNTPYSFVVQFGSTDTYMGISLPNTVRNVFEIEICYAIIANSNDEITKYPYIYVEINEIQSKMLSTSDHGRRSFVKLLKDKIWNESENSSVVHYSMMDKCIKPIKFDVPIASISKLSINIQSPSGKNLKTIKDVFQITDIFQDVNNFEITFSQYFGSDELSVDNRVRFTDLDLDNPELETFLRDNDHVILEATNQSSGGMWNKIKIAKESQIDTSNGTITYPSFSSISLKSGYIMNLSLQTNIAMTMKCRKTSLDYMTQIV
tara:strand:+ start:1512 stop:2846 length:1335 start_codon:yes stop_codon:yes gene_type:complete